MDWYPLWNSLRIAAVSSVFVFFLGIAAAYWAARLPRVLKGVLDVVLTLPLVLPPTVVGYFLLLLFGNRRPLGMALESIGVRFVMNWYGGILAAFVVAFPLMYRTARGAFESFDETLAQAGQTLGLSNFYIFWRIRMPACRQGILRALCWPLREPWENTGPPVCSSATLPAGRPPFPPPSISSGAQGRTGRPFCGWPSIWPSRRLCCWPSA